MPDNEPTIRKGVDYDQKIIKIWCNTIDLG